MKLLNFVVFFTVFFTVYGSANYYIFIRGWQALPNDTQLKIPYVGVFLFLALSYIAGRILGKYTVCGLSQWLTWVGSFWFGIIVYLFLILVAVDLLRLSNYFFHWFPLWITNNSDRAKQLTALTTIAITSVVMVSGYLNALHPRIRRIDIDIPTSNEKRESLTIALVTDIHLGTIINNSRLAYMVDMINDLHPDIVLLAGDIVDEDIRPVIEDNMGETLRNIRSRYGSYAVTGNHEYYGGVEESVRYLTEHGVTVLRDTAITIDERFVLVGREDRTLTQMTGRARKPLAQIIAGVEKNLPIIMMDHQPFGLYRAAQNKIDLQVSGHTHNGQLWPIQFITRMIFDLSWGYKKVGTTHCYVSCGYGTWGPPVRSGNQPEVVQITIHFKSTTQPEDNPRRTN
jgi:predicted MPP superfamily phosphohydrolase